MEKKQENLDPGTRMALRPREVMEVLGVSRPLLDKLRSEGRIRAIRAGRRWLFPVAALEEYLRQPG